MNGEPLLIGRYAEIALKGGNRPDFERALLRAARWRLPAGSRASIGGSRLLVRLPEGCSMADGARALEHVFGLTAVQPAWRLPRPLELAHVADGAIRLAQEAARDGARTFKIAARRADKSFPLDSPALNRRLGAEVLSATGLTVDVHRPDVELGVDVRSDAVYLWGRGHSGPGGLPTGTAGRAVALMSGGIDSPVAAYLAAKRGLSLAAVYCHTPPYTGEGVRQKVVDLCRLLTGYTGPIRLWVAGFTPVQLAIQERVPEAMRTLVSRRFMLRIALAVARRERAGALITGDSLGQVASQTLESLAATGEVADLPVLRPLVAMDKMEIVAVARRLETYPISIRPFDDCCSLFAPRHPRTRPTRLEVRAAEAALDVSALVDEAMAGSERLQVTPDGVVAYPPAGRVHEASAED